MKRVIAAALAASLLLLTACTGFRTSSEVFPGLDLDDAGGDPGVAFVPDGPQPGASPEQIVEGFVRAGTGTQNLWEIARSFLTEPFAEEWDPTAGVTVDRLRDRDTVVVAEGDDDAEVAMSATASGLVDAEGAYEPQAAASTPFAFALERDDAGEWRIAQAPDGIVLSEEQFRSVFRSAWLAFFDPTWQYLVRDVRWYPRANAEAFVARDLLDGPSETWLGGAVATAFPDDVALASASVTAVNGVAQVELSEEALPLDAVTLERMQAQLEESLDSVGITETQMTVDGTPLLAATAPTRSTSVDTRPLVQAADGTVGFIDGDEVTPLGELGDAVERLAPAAIETSPDRTTAAVLTDAGVVTRATDADTVAVLDERPGLVPPTIDPGGAIWSVPSDAPNAVRVSTAAGEVISVEGAWPDATRVEAMQVSREGARVAAVVSVGGRSEVWVAGVQRRTDGSRIVLGVPYPVATGVGETIDLAWLDDTTLGLLQRGADGEVLLRQQPVGGPGAEVTVPAGVSSVAGGNASPRLLADDGALYARQTSSWQRIAEGVAVLAVQQGSPG